MIHHHPDHALLLDYAAGSLPEPLALLVAAHVALCPECAAETARMEAVGGAMLENISPDAVSDDTLARALARLDEPAPEPEPLPVLDGETRAVLPSPLWRYVGGNLRDRRWRWRGPAMRESVLPVAVPGWRVALFRVRPGGTVPLHGHAGTEHTLVLCGGLTDRGSGLHLLRGDVETADAARTHDQVADEGEECLCLAVLDAPVRLRGLLGRVANPFLRF